MRIWTVGRALAAMGVMITVLAVVGRGTSHACVGTNCMEIWSTADGGGALTVQWDFPNRKVQTYASFCTPDNSQCLYSTIDPGFMAPTSGGDPANSYYVLKDTTAVSVVIVSSDPALSLNVNGQKLYQPGDTALLGTMPTIHNHPSWQLVVPGDQFGDYLLSYKLTTTSPDYSESQIFTAIVTNVPPPEETPTPTPTAVPATPCPGDCSGDGMVTVDELVTCVNIALGSAAVDRCPPCDANGDGSVAVDDIIAAVNAALTGCPTTVPATLDEIQQTIFTPSCAMLSCHDAQSKTGNLTLTAGASYGQLVNVAPDVLTARDAGLLRVDPGHPENSFLLLKLTGPPLGEGSPMPLTGAPLSADEIQLIRDWILQGAPP